MDVSNKKALVETLKSAGRFLWFGILGLIATVLTALSANGSVTNSTLYIGNLQVNMSIVVLALFSIVIKAIDTYVHNNDTVSSNGLAPAFLQQSTRKEVPMSTDVSELKNVLSSLQTEVEAVESSAEKFADTTAAVVMSHLQAALTAVRNGKNDDGAKAEDTSTQGDQEKAPNA